MPPLAGRQLQARTVIVGGGFAGLATAASLAERGERDTVLLEAASVGHGASGRNGGFVFGGFSLEPEDLLRQIGAPAARSLYAATREAVALIRARIAAHGIACDAVEGGALWLDWFNSPASRQAMAARQTLLQEQFGVCWQPVGPQQVRQWLQTERYGGALLERDALHFHPLVYARGLAAALHEQGVQVLERSGAMRIEAEPTRPGSSDSRWRVHTACGGSVCAERVLVAGGGYLKRVLPALEGARLPIATYVVATEPLADAQHPIRTPAALYDNRFAFDYYRRTVDDRILWGGRISILQRDSRRIAHLLKRDLLRVFPQLQGVRLTHAWGGLMSYARHQMPQIGQLAPGLWYAQAFGGHGVAPTTLAGEWLAEAMQGTDLPQALQRYGLSSVFGAAGLLAAQARYSWAELRDTLKDERR
ncbi:NAD(P)/FAD-dependent oxidoreductase [Inhella sp.]|uniref:NAD(P)/FAD-dependent oxidoreductase n=1 Tax=Inhella sp. TaxID=1921806 RepID=UPI0035B1C36A